MSQREIQAMTALMMSFDKLSDFDKGILIGKGEMLIELQERKEAEDGNGD